MEFFRSLLRAIGLYDPTKVDFIADLPLEISQLILRKLDAESLLCAAQVSKKWMETCTSDRLLRRTARRYKRAEKKRMEEEFELPLKVVRNKSRRLTNLSSSHRYPAVRINAATAFGETRNVPNSLRYLPQQYPSHSGRSARSLRI